VSGFSQPRLEKHYARKQYTTYDGLVQSQVNRVMQDSKGYLWICTKGGLSRFDGEDFQNFVDTKDGERINIQNIIETNNGFVVNSSTKIFRFTYEEENPEKWKFEDVKIPGDYRYFVTNVSFFNASDNSIYFSNVRKDGWKSDHFIHFRYDLTHKTFHPLPIGNKAIILTFTKQNVRYYLAQDRIYLLKNGIFISQTPPAKFDNYAMNPVDSALYAWQNSTKTIFRIEQDFLHFTPVCKNVSLYAFIDGEPNIFVINRSGKFIFLNNNRQVCFINQSQSQIVASVNFARYLFIGRENNLWVGSEEGLFNLFKLDFEQYVFNITQSIDNVWSLACDPHGTMWFGGYSTGLWSLNKREQLKIYSYHDFVPKPDSIRFRNMYMGGIGDKEGRIYFPSATGILIIDKNSLRYRDTRNVPMSFYDDKDHNRLILGKIAGLEIIEKGTWKTILEIPSTQNIISTCINREGMIIAGTFRNQLIVEGDSLKPYPSEKNLGVISMVKDSCGNIWKGTPVGLYLDDGKTETEIMPSLINGSISAVYIKQPWLMVTTVKNLFLINLDQYYRKGEAIAFKFGAENGYIAMDGGQNGFCEDNKGKIWYTVTDKVLRFSPDSLVRHYSNYLPKPHFTSVSYSKNAIDWQRVASNDTTDLINEHDFNSIRFTMFAISATQPGKVVYQYRLKGMSNDWSKPTRVTEQSFTNLNPGNYQIEIRSSLDGEHWTQIVNSRKIRIKWAWWQNWWAYAIGIILFGTLIAHLAIYIVKRRQKKMIRKLEEHKRLNELRLQSVRSKNIPHFSGNALANIEHFIFNADLRRANKFLSKYSRLMNITLRDADKASRSIEQELEYVKLYLELEKMRFEEKLEYFIDVADDVNQEKELPNMLMQTWVENSIKHGFRQKEGVGRIHVKITKRDSNGISVCVQDNGIGRLRAKELGTSGTGQGLKILSEQIAIYNQINRSKIEVNTSDIHLNGVVQGTKFEMIIPMEYSFDF
jgi:streptogramin lyase